MDGGNLQAKEVGAFIDFQAISKKRGRFMGYWVSPGVGGGIDGLLSPAAGEKRSTERSGQEGAAKPDWAISCHSFG